MIMHTRVDLHEAAFSGNIGVLCILLDKGQDPDCKDENGQTALHKAAMNGNLDCIKILIGKGAETHIQDQAGCTALHHAAKNGHLVVVKWLIQEADVKLLPCSKKERTPRASAKRNGHRKVVLYLAEMENKQDGCAWLGNS